MKILMHSSAATAIVLGFVAACSPTGGDTYGERDLDYELAYQRAVQAVIWGMPAASMISFREAFFRDADGDFGDIFYMGGLGEPRHEALTANSQTPYATVLLNVKDEPMVLEIPPASSKVALFGSAIDVWQVPVADVGPTGADAGRGGRYLFLPPGYDGPVPSGFFPVQMETYGIFVALRPIVIGDGTLEDAIANTQTIKAYPLAAADDPPANRYIDIYPLERLGTLPEYDMSFFEDLARLVNEEVALERDKVMLGMLASIGIQKGVPFEPDEKTRSVLEQAIVDGRAMMEHYFETPGRAFEMFWPDRQWGAFTTPSESGFVFDEGDEILLDARAGGAFYWATFVPKELGAGSYYLMCLRDQAGDLLLGSNSYRLRVPADVPTRDFWSVIVYSKDTKAFIYNDLNRTGLSSYETPNMVGNDDGTFDIYFGPVAPQGLESNWIPTAGEDFFLLFRFYGPEPALYEKEWKLPDVEKVN
jgi:hypothetical protein